MRTAAETARRNVVADSDSPWWLASGGVSGQNTKENRASVRRLTGGDEGPVYAAVSGTG
jgi:hypothetical protein